MSRLIIILIILSLPSIGQLFTPGFFGASDDLHVAWLHQFNRALIVDQQIPPRYVPDLSYGFGYPLFNFVFPLPFLIGEFFHLSGLNLVDSIKGVFALSLVFSSVGMYVFVKKLGFSKSTSIFSSMLYLYAPYRATDVYIRGALGESLAISIFPWIAAFTISSPSRKNSAILAILIAALVTTHNISAFIFVPIVMILLFLLKNLKFGLISILLGLGISSFFWIPALIDSKLMFPDTVFNPLDHFPTIRQLVTPFWGYGASVPGPYDGMSFFQGVFQIIFGAFGCLLLVKNKKSKVHIWSFGILVVSLFLMNHRSQSLWTTLPLFGFIQFPWRFQFISLFSLVILSTLLTKTINQKLITLSTVLLILFSGFMFAPNEQLGRMDSYFINRYIPVPQASIEYTQTMEEYLRLPLTTQKRPDKNVDLVQVPEGVSFTFVNISPLKTEIKTSSLKDFPLTFNRYYFPGWTASDSMGNELPMYAGNPYGQIVVDVKSGNQLITIDYKQTQRNRVLNIFSIIILIATLILVFI